MSDLIGLLFLFPLAPVAGVAGGLMGGRSAPTWEQPQSAGAAAS
jgi:hypothetical protein